MSAAFDTGRDSPVSAASLTRRSVVVSNRASAGTACPAMTSMTSPGTSRAASTTCRWPSRTTDARGTSSCRNASMARRARHSVRNPIAVLMASTAAIAAASTTSPIASEMIAAANNSTTTTLASWSRRISSADTGGGGVSWFGPVRAQARRSFHGREPSRARSGRRKRVLHRQRVPVGSARVHADPRYPAIAPARAPTP